MPRLSKRKINIYFKPPHVSEQEIARIIKLWDMGNPLPAIIRRCQLQGEARGGVSLSYVDIYTILHFAIQAGKAKDRNLNGVNELPVKAFANFYGAWKEGGTLDECIEAVREADRKRASRTFMTNLFRTMSDRFRAESKQNLEPALKEADKQVDNDLVQMLMEHARRVTITVAGKPRHAIVIFIDEIPLKHLAAIQQTKTDVAKDLSLLTNASLLTNEQAFQALAFQPPKQKEPDSLEDQEELAVLSEHTIPHVPEIEEALNSQVAPLQIRSANNPEINADAHRSPEELSLENLMDDDDPALPREEQS